MAQSVSNDALWEKLKEMDTKLDKLFEVRESAVPNRERKEIIPDFSEAKKEIITEIKGNIRILGLSNDSHFDANRKNIQMLNENILNNLKVTTLIRKKQRESVEPQKEDKESRFNFKFFKVGKTPFVITVLSLLVFILTLFCMKQQNDYSLLMNEYYKRNITVREPAGELKEIIENKKGNKAK